MRGLTSERDQEAGTVLVGTEGGRLETGALGKASQGPSVIFLLHGVTLFRGWQEGRRA